MRLNIPKQLVVLIVAGLLVIYWAKRKVQRVNLNGNIQLHVGRKYIVEVRERNHQDLNMLEQQAKEKIEVQKE